MKDGAPTELIVPQVLASTTFMVDGEKIDIEQPESYAAYVWIPSAKTILGGTGVARGIHVWTADTQTPASRKEWQQTLESMAAHKPERVIEVTIWEHHRQGAVLSTLPVIISSASNRRCQNIKHRQA